MTQYGGRYELLDSKGESGQPTLSITAQSPAGAGLLT